MHRFLNAVSSFFRTARYWVEWIAGAARETSLPPWIYRALHVVLVITTVLLFGFFSPWITEPKLVDISDAWYIQNYYWGYVVLLVYVLVRAVIWLVRLLSEGDEEFEDIRRAWEAGLSALDRVGLDLQWLPMFLVVGASEEEDSLFRGAHLPWKTTAPGRDDAAPVRIYATDEAIFVACPGIGAVATQRASGQSSPAPAAFSVDRTQRPYDPNQTLDPAALSDDASSAGGADATLDPATFAGSGRGDFLARLAGSEASAPSGVAATLAPPSAAGTLVAGGGGILAAAKSASSLQQRPLTQAELDLAARRLEYLCRLVNEARGEFCPINGLLLVLPLAWSGGPAGPEADKVARTAREDLDLIHHSFGLAFPTTVLYTGLERSPGLRQFVERGMRINQKFLETRAGSKFPPGTSVEAASARWAVDAGLHWFRDWCYSLFSQGLSEGTNGQVYRLLCDLQGRRDALSRQLQLVFEGASGPEAARLSGVYYCAAGRSERDRAFVQGTFRKLVDAQDDVAWTDERYRRDASRRSLAYAGLAVAGVLAILNGWLIYLSIA